MSVTLGRLTNFIPLCLVISRVFSCSIRDPANFLTCKGNSFLFLLLYLKVSAELSLVIGTSLCKPSGETPWAEGSSALSVPFPCLRADGNKVSSLGVCEYSIWGCLEGVCTERMYRGCHMARCIGALECRLTGGDLSSATAPICGLSPAPEAHMSSAAGH